MESLTSAQAASAGPGPDWVDGAYWRSIFLTMAEMYAPAWALEFADAHPIRNGLDRLAGADLLEHIVIKEGKVPEDWDFATTIGLERFLAEKGRPEAEAFQNRVLNRNNRSTWIPGRLIIRTLFRFLWKARMVSDSRAVVFRLIGLIAKAMFPNQKFALLHRAVAGGKARAILLIATDRTYRTAHPANIDYAMVPQMKKSPLALGLPEFESVRVRADCRPPEAVVWGDGYGPVDDGDAVDMPFREFCASLGCGEAASSLPEAVVRVPQRPVRCDARGRVVLHAGCAYSAPVYLLEFEYRTSPWEVSAANFDPVLADVRGDPAAAEAKALGSLRDLIASQKRPHVLVFDARARRIKSGKTVLANGYMADTLRILMHELGDQEEVEVRVLDLRDHPWLHGAEAVNHNTVNKRLKQRLEKLFPLLVLELIGRGRLRFRRLGSVILKEA